MATRYSQADRDAALRPGDMEQLPEVECERASWPSLIASTFAIAVVACFLIVGGLAIAP